MDDDITQAEFREETAQKGTGNPAEAQTAMSNLVPILFLGGGFKGSEPYQQGMEAASRNREVIRALGEPIESAGIITGELSLGGLSGEADLRIPIRGPEGRGVLYVAGRKENGVWVYYTFAVAIRGTDKIVPLDQP